MERTLGRSLRGLGMGDFPFVQVYDFEPLDIVPNERFPHGDIIIFTDGVSSRINPRVPDNVLQLFRERDTLEVTDEAGWIWRRDEKPSLDPRRVFVVSQDRAGRMRLSHPPTYGDYSSSFSSPDLETKENWKLELPPARHHYLRIHPDQRPLIMPVLTPYLEKMAGFVGSVVPREQFMPPFPLTLSHDADPYNYESIFKSKPFHYTLRFYSEPFDETFHVNTRHKAFLTLAHGNASRHAWRVGRLEFEGRVNN